MRAVPMRAWLLAARRRSLGGRLASIARRRRQRLRRPTTTTAAARDAAPCGAGQRLHAGRRRRAASARRSRSHVGSGWGDACERRRVPDAARQCPSDVEAVLRSRRTASLACVADACDRPAPTGYAIDATGCLSCAVRGGPPAPPCSVDTDCVRAPADCCGCARGRQDTAVPAAEARRVRRAARLPRPAGLPRGSTSAIRRRRHAASQGRCELARAARRHRPMPDVVAPTCRRAPSGETCVINTADATEGQPASGSVCVRLHARLGRHMARRAAVARVIMAALHECRRRTPGIRLVDRDPRRRRRGVAGRRGPRRPLPRHQEARRRRHGRGLRGRAHPHREEVRDQAAASRDRVEPGGGHAVPPGGALELVDRSPQHHRRSTTSASSPTAASTCAWSCSTELPLNDLIQAAAAARSAAQHPDPDRPRARRRAREEHRPPRHEAREHLRHRRAEQRGHPQAPRLRHREGRRATTARTT